ncbi:hypothetical protein L6164_002273 [Bauhinia variegata]|uniref:Uncharacterized protein n=1 Tax=Bauhinia variegata TaxID=167791 RepID=A0ACB9PZI4_BAUVA|nr:hypothetical protein L6164_002273 [Bauhinia variegata]
MPVADLQARCLFSCTYRETTKDSRSSDGCLVYTQAYGILGRDNLVARLEDERRTNCGSNLDLYALHALYNAFWLRTKLGIGLDLSRGDAKIKAKNGRGFKDSL